MSTLFISHSSHDDAFVRSLQQALGDLKQDVWIDSRELRAGDPLWPAIQKAIEEASAYAVVVSPDSLQSNWVGKELRHALEDELFQRLAVRRGSRSAAVRSASAPRPALRPAEPPPRSDGQGKTSAPPGSHASQTPAHLRPPAPQGRR
jgi:hypothetical protein